jgi:S-DNA-T family DNA segregation ATPase FtsK/SpoIIIE
VDVLPARISYDEAMELSDGERLDELTWALAGVRGDQLRPMGVDLRDLCTIGSSMPRRYRA